MRFTKSNAKKHGRRGGLKSQQKRREKEQAERLKKFTAFIFTADGQLIGETKDGDQYILT